MVEHFDVIIVGAGLSGIGAAVHLQKTHPGKTYAVLEARDAIGGTWDLFRYPGIRSDSDMFTLGYVFKPWVDSKAIADGPSILSYVRETARENGIEPHIRFGHKVTRVSWSSDDARWTVHARRAETDELVRFTTSFVWSCSGYYDYARGHTPELAGRERFGGTIVHPQSWPEDLDYAGKRVVVIGSGATAVTLVPELAKKAAHVTMLQRSPTYVVSRPAEDALANWLRGKLPATLAYDLARWKNVLLGHFFYELARRKPALTKKRILELIQKELGPDYDMTHFSPRYAPWDQRLCLVPDNDLFIAIREQRAAVVTDHIDTFTETGIRLRSGDELPADIVVTATGLSLIFLGGVELVVDGRALDPHQLTNYKGTMMSDVPNLAVTFGYTNASWTLKADLTADYVCRLLRLMDERGVRQVTPRRRDPSVTDEPFLDFSSGYVQRALASFPKQGSRRPWKLYQNYIRDIAMLRHGKIDDGELELASPAPRTARAASASSAVESRARPLPS